MGQDETGMLDDLEHALEAIGEGGMAIVVDDADRENEGDFVLAAEKVTPEAINFMMTHGRGLICLPMTPAKLDQLGLPPMAHAQVDRMGTAFTISIDLEDPGRSGIAASDRAACIRAAVGPSAAPELFRRPGNVFPLKAQPGGVLRRAGHTEASVDLARLAGLQPAAVICEILNEDGTMARLPQLREVADRFDLPLVSIASLIRYRHERESLVERVVEAPLPTPVGVFRAVGYYHKLDDLDHLALLYGNPEGKADVMVRMHSECLTGDIFDSRRCECGEQLRVAMQVISERGEGVIVYIRGHEGRGIGLLHKLQAYALQDQGLDTVEANTRLGLPVDSRDYGTGAQILADLDLSTLRLLTNNPAKRIGLEGYGLTVAENLPLQIAPRQSNARYLEAKRQRMGHDLPPIET